MGALLQSIHRMSNFGCHSVCLDVWASSESKPAARTMCLSILWQRYSAFDGRGFGPGAAVCSPQHQVARRARSCVRCRVREKCITIAGLTPTSVYSGEAQSADASVGKRCMHARESAPSYNFNCRLRRVTNPIAPHILAITPWHSVTVHALRDRWRSTNAGGGCVPSTNSTDQSFP